MVVPPDFPTIKITMKEATQERRPRNNTKQVCYHTSNQQNSKLHVTATANRVSEVFVDPASWMSTEACSTPESFVGRLRIDLFDMKTLLNSNLKGEASKFVDQVHERKEKLYPKKMLALQGQFLK